VAIGNLADGRPVQPPLPFARSDAAALDTAMDAVRDQFGKAAVTRAVLLGARDIEFPHLPD
jgi:DNA polymerase-4